MPKPYKPTQAEQKRKNQATMDLYAALSGKPQIQLTPVAPVREKKQGPRAQPTEHQEQVRVIHWWRHAHTGYGLPENALFAIPNGGRRDMIEGAHLKAEGVRAGIPDLFLAAYSVRGNGLFIEMKSLVGKPSEEQKRFIEYARSVGYQAQVAYGSDEAISAIKNFLDLL